MPDLVIRACPDIRSVAVVLACAALPVVGSMFVATTSLDWLLLMLGVFGTILGAAVAVIWYQHRGVVYEFRKDRVCVVRPGREPSEFAYSDIEIMRWGATGVLLIGKPCAGWRRASFHLGARTQELFSFWQTVAPQWLKEADPLVLHRFGLHPQRSKIDAGELPH